jgi:hypothetical protein
MAENITAENIMAENVMAGNTMFEDKMTEDPGVDVILAECGGQAWLVRGEQHIDHLLANTLDAHISVEIIACESKSEVNVLWRKYDGGDDPDEGMMWLIHPAIANRVRKKPSESAVLFAAWSASLDEAATAAVRTAAEAATQQPDCALALVRYIAPDGPAMAMDLANLRSGLLEAQLASLGVAASRMLRDTRDATQPGQDDRIDLLIRATG